MIISSGTNAMIQVKLITQLRTIESNAPLLN